MEERVGGIEDRALMTTPCTRCGGPVAPDELRCPACDALAPLPDDPTRADPPLSGPSGPRSLDDEPPWAIPIREPTVARTPWLPGGLGRVAGLALLGVAIFAATVVIGAQLLTDDGADGTRAASVSDPDTDPDTADDGSDDVDARSVRAEAEETTTSSTTSTSSTTTSSTTTSTSTTTAPTTTAPPIPAGTGPVPALSSSFRSGWVAQLSSVPYTAGTSGLEAAWEEVRAYAPDAVAVRSDDLSSHADGFWVLLDPGPYSSDDAVRSFCASVDHSRGHCEPRQLQRG